MKSLNDEIASGLSKKELAVVKTALKSIEQRDGLITARAVVQEAAPEKSPLHRYFEWNDTAAGERWRIHQARMLIANVHVRIGKSKETVRAFVNISIPSDVEEGEEPEEDLRGYMSIEKTAQNPNLKAQILNYAKAQLLMWRKKFGNYEQFYKVASEIDKL